jgi:hypothetical protein
VNKYKNIDGTPPTCVNIVKGYNNTPNGPIATIERAIRFDNEYLLPFLHTPTNNDAGDVANNNAGIKPNIFSIINTTTAWTKIKDSLSPIGLLNSHAPYNLR